MAAFLFPVPKAPHLDTLENVIKLSQILIQATSYTKSPLLQLPHVLPEHLRYFASKKVGVFWLTRGYIFTVLLQSLVSNFESKYEYNPNFTPKPDPNLYPTTNPGGLD